jgi:hypothetical protein
MAPAAARRGGVQWIVRNEGIAPSCPPSRQDKQSRYHNGCTVRSVVSLDSSALDMRYGCYGYDTRLRRGWATVCAELLNDVTAAGLEAGIAGEAQQAYFVRS